jgi:hypothetical protein
MKLEYTILWLENDLETIKLKSPEIIKYLDNLNFTANIIPKEDDSDIIQVITEKDVNLILVDYNLQERKKGDTVIGAIRQNKLFNEVVFYSAGAFRDKIANQLEGVFYASIDNLVDKTKAIIDITLKKNQDISNIRGLFIAETTYLTKQMEDVIIQMLELDGEAMNFFHGQIVQEEFFNDYAKYKIIKRFLNKKKELLKQKIPSTKDPEQSQLKALLKQVEDIYDDFGHYQQEVIELRNDLAHAKKSDNGRYILCIHNKETGCFEDKVYDEKKCSETRKNFLKHGQRLKELAIIVQELKKVTKPQNPEPESHPS